MTTVIGSDSDWAGKPVQNPEQPTLQTIHLKSEEQIGLEANSILALVGPNNSGKSYFIKQLRAILYGKSIASASIDRGLIKSVEVRWPTGDLRSYLRQVAESNFKDAGTHYDPELPYSVYGSSPLINKENFSRWDSPFNRFGVFIETFVRFDEPLSRITESDRKSLEDYGNAIVKLRDQKDAYDAVREAFKYIFNEEIHFHFHEGKLTFFLGPRPQEMPSIADANSVNVIEFLKSARTIDQQGLGMRNVVGLLMRLYTDSRSVVLIDEPEAFLHPPQAYRLGQVLQRVCQEEKRQIVCATHDRNLLSGMAREGSKQLVVHRLSYKGDVVNQYSSTNVQPDAFEDIRAKSRIRYTPILESLFSAVAVLVENENDALFFEEAFDNYESGSTVPQAHALNDSIIFIPTNGNGNFASIADLLRRLRTPTLIVGDLDLISEKKRLLNTVSVMGRHKYSEVDSLAAAIWDRFREVYSAEFEGISKQNSEGKLKSRIAKDIKADHKDEEIRRLVEELLKSLASIGILLLPVGELEGFDRSLFDSGDKNLWARKAIDSKVYENEAVLSFCADVASAASRVINVDEDASYR
ncbi:Vitamin B12 import ATP-binding protein BtuD [Corynebacterium afermentans subsp. afermentans]|uniref:AAA domain-containing protein, putative AbiEii toxin, Type IV TA system n=1 Tax=Corynebacterium afermentans TaxID=38286 RepID=A0A9X8WIJ2_9CORY|nr:AAA family ATPase [Corynebacterium afermentans]WJY57761.1 Vitamin B12 import ATP-binding protein BtuD [Corynebacterium afermentans subsp. afermentans]SIQ40446.1 AAA domain-containing protein, putative AbiEii toxin, Type IV TA system [Corynebacterium afermentans]